MDEGYKQAPKRCKPSTPHLGMGARIDVLFRGHAFRLRFRIPGIHPGHRSRATEIHRGPPPIDPFVAVSHKAIPNGSLQKPFPFGFSE